MRVLNLLYNFCLKHITFCEEVSEIWSKIHIVLHVEYFYTFPILMKLELPRQTREKYSDFMKIRSLKAELLHRDGQTDEQN
jgi:hypothetical protein